MFKVVKLKPMIEYCARSKKEFGKKTLFLVRNINADVTQLLDRISKDDEAKVLQI